MHCRPISFPGGGVAFVCGPRPRTKACATPGCGRRGRYECDWPVTRGGKSGTCDRLMCERCRRQQDPGTLMQDSVDYCRVHDEMARAARADSAGEHL